MMQLSNADISRLLDLVDLVDPSPSEKQLGSVSIDLCLGNRFKVFLPNTQPYIDLCPRKQEDQTDIEAIMSMTEIADGEPFYLHPGAFALGITKERVHIPDDLVGHLDGRSSLARVGLMVHATAQTIHPGWNGRITLEFVNCGPNTLAMRPGMRICSLSFHVLQTPTTKPYAAGPNSKYIAQNTPLASKIIYDK